MQLLKDKGVDTTAEYVATVVGLIKERAVFVADLWELGRFFFEAPQEFDAKASKKAWKEDTGAIMAQVKDIISNLTNFTSEEIQNAVKGWIVANELGFGKVMQPLRLSLVGAMQGPDVFEIASAIGKEETISRIKKAIASL